MGMSSILMTQDATQLAFQCFCLSYPATMCNYKQSQLLHNKLHGLFWDRSRLQASQSSIYSTFFAAFLMAVAYTVVFLCILY